jgi:hypothetical protein
MIKKTPQRMKIICYRTTLLALLFDAPDGNNLLTDQFIHSPEIITETMLKSTHFVK